MRRENGDDPLEKFNRRVRDRLGPKILRRVGVRFPFKYVSWLIFGLRFVGEDQELTQTVSSTDNHFSKNLGEVLFLVMVSNLAALPGVITNLVEGSGHLMSWSHRAIWSSLVFLRWFQRCLVMIFFLEISVRLWTLLKFRRRKVAWAMVLSPIQFGVVGCFWICLELSYIEESWVPFVVFLVALTLCVLLHLW